MDEPGKDVCVHCGAPIYGDLDFCVRCGFDPRSKGPGTPGASPRPGAGAPHPPIMAPPVNVPKGRVSLGLVIGIIGLLMAVVAMSSIGWFVIEDTNNEYGVTCGLRSIEYNYGDGGSSNYDYSRTYVQLEKDMDQELDMRGVAGATFWLMVVGLSLATLFILFALLSLIGMFRGASAWLPLLTGLIAGILMIVGASYFGIAFQDAMERDTNSDLADSTDTDYGLGGVWYLALFGGIMVLVGSFLTYVRPTPPVQPRPMV